jgi:alpha-beta hydrolase superfamily lysophospholipase
MNLTVHRSRTTFARFNVYAPDQPRALVLAFHGHGSNASHWEENKNGTAIKDALVSSGFAFVGAGHVLNSKTWGADSSLRVYRRALMWARTLFPNLPFLIYANSMGCIEALNAISAGMVERPIALVGTSPTASLAAAFNADHRMFRKAIRIAYGAVWPRSYESATADHDPMLIDPSVFAGIPMLLLPAEDDPIVPPAQHAVPFAARVGPSVSVVRGINGGHSFSFAPFSSAIASHFATALP